MTPADNRSARKELAAAFRAYRTELAEAFFQAVKEAENSAGFLPQSMAELHEWWRAALLIIVDLGREWLKQPDDLQRDLFSGWIAALNHPYMHPPEAQEFSSARILEQAQRQWLGFLAPRVSAPAAKTLGEILGRLAASLSRPPCKRLRVLFIGDCISYEILASLAGPCAQVQVAIDSVHTSNRVPAMLRNEIRDPAMGEFDLVFLSPFSYTFAPEYGQMLRWSTALQPRRQLFTGLNQMLDDLALTVRRLADRFNCPIYVHNSAAIVQIFNPLVGVAKYAFTLRNRVDARPFIGQRVKRIVADSAVENGVRLLDEESLREQHGDFALGTVLFRGSAFHPTRFSVELARGPYLDAIVSRAHLANKKVVVCDLDNTLWDGVIGEGAVRHFEGRQKTLKGLRNRGVLLSINSKNDPARVHFTGGVLQLADFVAARINWDSKVQNMRSILEELNLKEKDFIFIDDRRDELERIQDAFPAMTVLDATQESTWRWLAHWEQHLPADQQEDRTRLYHERAAREQFLSRGSEQASSPDEEVEALRKLELAVKIEHATRPSDLKRAVELVNRTNQFNLCGSRVTAAELEKGLGADQWLLTAAARDKFGSMGVVGVMLVKRAPHGLEIPVFVLSCRAFGFGIEYALLNAVSELASPASQIVGLYQETPHNNPCRNFYAKAGLRQEESRWIGDLGDLAPAPVWLTIDNPAMVRS